MPLACTIPGYSQQSRHYGSVQDIGTEVGDEVSWGLSTFST
jgi:hypothetical protein